MKRGDSIRITDGNGIIYHCLLQEANSKRCFVDILKQEIVSKSRNYRIDIAFAPTKQSDRNEWFVEKATEIGIDRFILFKSLHSERKTVKKDRLRNIAISAIKQSQQAYLPIIEEVVDFKHLITKKLCGEKYIAHCSGEPRKPLAQLYKKGENVLILIGPEGGFSPEEILLAAENNFMPVSLGETRLRTETACFAALHTVHIINNQ